MVKFRNKLKFSSKGTSDNTGESTIGDSLGSSSGGGDTNPFGSGGAVQQKVGSNTNPFADSSGGSNPFADSGGGGARQQQQRQQKRGSNPFGEDDDDSEYSDPLSGFSRKRPPTVVHQGTSKSPGSANGGGMGKISRPISAPKPPPSPAMASPSQVRRPSSSSSPWSMLHAASVENERLDLGAALYLVVLQANNQSHNSCACYLRRVRVLLCNLRSSVLWSLPERFFQ